MEYRGTVRNHSVPLYYFLFNHLLHGNSQYIGFIQSQLRTEKQETSLKSYNKLANAFCMCIADLVVFSMHTVLGRLITRRLITGQSITRRFITADDASLWTIDHWAIDHRAIDTGHLIIIIRHQNVLKLLYSIVR